MMKTIYQQATRHTRRSTGQADNHDTAIFLKANQLQGLPPTVTVYIFSHDVALNREHIIIPGYDTHFILRSKGTAF